MKAGNFTANTQELTDILLPYCLCPKCDGRQKCCLIDEDYLDTILHNAIARSIDHDKCELDSFRASPTHPVQQTTASTLRDSIFSQVSSIRSSSVESARATNSLDDISIIPHRTISLEVLKDRLISELVSNFNVSLYTLVRLGNLRLADKLLIEDGNDFVATNCYLFDNYLLIASPQVKLIDLHKLSFDVKHDTILINGNIHIKSQKSPIIEKWCIGLLDHYFVFPLEIVSSTICMTLSATNNDTSTDSDTDLPCAPLNIRRTVAGLESPQNADFLQHSRQITPTINTNSVMDHVIELNTFNLLDLGINLDNLGVFKESKSDESEDDDDDDYDSDQEQINLLLNNKWEHMVNKQI